MELQSARITKQVNGVWKDHKDIVFGGRYHEAVYRGNELVWRKLRGQGIDVTDTSLPYAHRVMGIPVPTPFYYGRPDTERYISKYGPDLESAEPVILNGEPLSESPIYHAGGCFDVHDRSQTSTRTYYVSGDLVSWETIKSYYDIDCFTENYAYVADGSYVSRWTFPQGEGKLEARYHIPQLANTIYSVVGSVGENLFIRINSGENAGLNVVDENGMFHHTAFDKVPVFYTGGYAYLVTTDYTVKTVYQLDGLGNAVGSYTFSLDADINCFYAYKGFFLLAAVNDNKYYVYNIESGEVELRPLTGYRLSGTLPGVCYENESGLNMVLCREEQTVKFMSLLHLNL